MPSDFVTPLTDTRGNSGFFDAINGDRVYSAEDMNKPYSRLVSDGVFATEQGTPGTDFAVRSAGYGAQITVSPGQGIFAGKWAELRSSINYIAPTNGSTSTRVDSVIVRVDTSAQYRRTEIRYRPGTPGEGKPDLINEGSITEYRLANISVAPGANAITNANITDTRGSAECPWVTSLIEQVDTSALWAQYQAAYSEQYAKYAADYTEYTNEQRQAWQDFIEGLTDELTVATNVMAFSSSYTAAGTTTTVPIGLSSYDPAADVLFVFINGLMAAGKYTVSPDNLSINLTNAISAGTVVSFLCLKSVIGGDIASTLSAIQALDARLTAAITDTGWVTLELADGVQNVNGRPLAARRIGSVVYLRGEISAVYEYDKLIATLPANWTPSIWHSDFTSITNGNFVYGVCCISVKPDGRIVLGAATAFPNSNISAPLTYKIYTSFPTST